MIPMSYAVPSDARATSRAEAREAIDQRGHATQTREALRSARAEKLRRFGGRSRTVRRRTGGGQRKSGSGAPGWRKTSRSRWYREPR